MGAHRPAARRGPARHRLRPGHRHRRPERARRRDGGRRPGSRDPRGRSDRGPRRRAPSAARPRHPEADRAPREGDEAARDEPVRRAGGYVQTDVDAWLAQALATGRGHYADSAAGLLPAPVRVHTTALLTAPHRLAPDTDTDVDELGFAARLTAAGPAATRELTAFLTCTADTTGGPVVSGDQPRPACGSVRQDRRIRW
ncbi:hypothetical protein [Streptomyces sp. NPDC056290]|uniref:hypothetical protein n=1 Tax=Streptomyces sp. NPDC056290 TaxID=3345771 RepID=UPI0035E29976